MNPLVSPKKTYFNFRNGLSLIFKNMKASELLYKLPFRLVLDWVAAIKFLFQGSPKDSLAVAKAHVHFFLRVGKDLKKRERINHSGNKELPIYHWSIVFDHYLLKKKRFSDLGF